MRPVPRRPLPAKICAKKRGHVLEQVDLLGVMIDDLEPIKKYSLPSCPVNEKVYVMPVTAFCIRLEEIEPAVSYRKVLAEKGHETVPVSGANDGHFDEFFELIYIDRHPGETGCSQLRPALNPS
jgi:hypothetical protein